MKAVIPLLNRKARRGGTLADYEIEVLLINLGGRRLGSLSDMKDRGNKLNLDGTQRV
jgi:hypothetical protein